MTGENWKRKVELQSGFPYWYNEDTGEAQWEQPKVIYEREAQVRPIAPTRPPCCLHH